MDGVILKHLKCGKEEDNIIQIWKDASFVGHSFLGEKNILDQEDIIRKQCFPIAKTIGAYYNNILVGFISLIENEVGGLFVSPQYHKKGIGRKLIESVQELYNELTVCVFEENENARGFYKKMGFTYCFKDKEELTGHTQHHLKWNK